MLTLKLKQLRRSLTERFGGEQSIGITQLRRVSLNEIRLLSISMSTSSRPLIILNLGRPRFTDERDLRPPHDGTLRIERASEIPFQRSSTCLLRSQVSAVTGRN
ncbi:MAG: hypothetical protein ACTS4V_00580 [Candidatus Hodgkinia cicadicola]